MITPTKTCLTILLPLLAACALLAGCKTAPSTTGPHPIGTNSTADAKDSKASVGHTGKASMSTSGPHPSSGN